MQVNVEYFKKSIDIFFCITTFFSIFVFDIDVLYSFRPIVVAALIILVRTLALEEYFHLLPVYSIKKNQAY